jgi:UDP-glucose 4-epimerase
MSTLVTGSSGHLGEALVRTLRENGKEVLGIDVKPGHYTDQIGSIADRGFIRQCMKNVHAVIHAATLHKPHVATHSRQEFIDTNITGTLILLEEAIRAGGQTFMFTSTTSAFGSALTPAKDDPAAWITEEVQPIPKNIYGATKLAAEHLCEVFAHQHKLAVIILRTSRFFPEPDDNAEIRTRYSLENAQANEFLYRRVDIQDVVSAHLAAIEKAKSIGFGHYIISATAPFDRDCLMELRRNAPAVVQRLYPEMTFLYAARHWSMFPDIDRVYVNARARAELGWQPKYDFRHVLACLKSGVDFRSELARAIGSKGYHDTTFADGPYPVV